jgi:uncharacterized protein YvpB
MKPTIKLLIIFIFCLGVGWGIVYFLIFPPRVINTDPTDGSQNISLDSFLIIKFDKPVKRQELQHFITPQVYGEWKFEDPLIKNHLFRTLVFIPAIEFKPSTQYQVKLENIVSPIGIGLANNFSFNFKTEALSSKEDFQEETQFENSQNHQADLTSNSKKITIIDIPLDWQDHALSCEAASLKMALNGKGVYVSEEDIMRKIGYDQTRHKGNIWGDPYQAYVGDIDGKICETGYGVYWEPVAKAAQNFREAEAFSGWKLEDIVREIELGNPVIVWGTLPVGTLTDCSWYTPDGKYIKAYRETHVRLMIGFIGDAENPLKIILNDPLAGRLYWSVAFFLTNWKVFGYSGVAIR